MPVADARLSLLAFPQRWENGKLRLRALVLPKGNPLQPLAAGQPAFAGTSLSLTARLISSLDRMPQPADAGAPIPFTAPPIDSLALFTELSEMFNVVNVPIPAATPLPKRAIKKHLMPSYRAAFAFSQPRENCFTDSSYECALTGPERATRPLRPPPKDEVSWGQIIAFALKQPVLAQRLGLIVETVLDLPAGEPLENGGWVYVDLAAGSPFAADATLCARYAARLPALHSTTAERSLFAATLFPVTTDPIPAGALDAACVEAESYDDGFAKIVHGHQPKTGDVLGVGGAQLPVIKATGLRLGWDDEQIVTWLNRQISRSAADPRNLEVDSPLGVSGYRVDVRAAGATDWHSLCRVKGQLNAGRIPLGEFNGELSVVAAPANLRGDAASDLWMPTYFATWSGHSLVVADPTAFELAPQPGNARDRILEAVAAGEVPLKFGNDYEFRVRLVDLTGGGPRFSDGDPFNPAPAPVTRLAFRRHTRPKTIDYTLRAAAADPALIESVDVLRPRLSYPDLAFTALPSARAALLADLPAAKLEEREVGVFDPDVDHVRIEVQVRDPGSGEFVPIFSTGRTFPAAPSDPIKLVIEYRDAPQISEMTATDPHRAELAIGSLVLPTARDVKLKIRPMGRSDSQLAYFGSEEARHGLTAAEITTRAPSSDERGLFVSRNPREQLQAILLQPDEAPSGVLDAKHAVSGRRNEEPMAPLQRLANQLGLELDETSLSGRRDTRTVFGCSSALRHTFSMDRSVVTFGSASELVQRWVVAIRVRIDRDWTWDGLKPSSIAVTRDGLPVGEIEIPNIISALAATHGDRSGTDLVYFDAIDPAPAPGEFPREILARYDLAPRFRMAPDLADELPGWSIRLPIAAPPVQTPKLISVGLATSPYSAALDYSSTVARTQMLWVEFDRPPADPADRYFARVLSYGPDPLLAASAIEIPEMREPPLPVDAELMRVITPEQPADEAGWGAMQELIPSSDPVAFPCHFLVPLPPGMTADSPELFGFFVYEIRLGHDRTRWCTARARHGPPLRISGVQHPPPVLACRAMRNDREVLAHAPYATTFWQGRSLRPRIPKTEMWILLYVQVTQADGGRRRNILLDHARANPAAPDDRDQRLSDEWVSFGAAQFSQDRIVEKLALLGLPRKSPLSVLAAELLETSPWSGVEDPLGADLGEVRILRTSPLSPVPEIC